MAAVYLVDACISGAPPGAIRRFDATAAALPELGSGLSTHGFGVSVTIEPAGELDRLPLHCVLYAIEGGSFDLGAPLSPPVAEAVAGVVWRLRAEIDLKRADSGSQM